MLAERSWVSPTPPILSFLSREKDLFDQPPFGQDVGPADTSQKKLIAAPKVNGHPANSSVRLQV